MKYIKRFEHFVLNENYGKLKNLLFSTILSLGLKYSDAQTIQKDSIKTEVIKDISNFNKSILFNTSTNKEIALTRLINDLSDKIKNPNFFVENYLRFQQNGTVVVRPNFIEGLELHLNKRQFDISYNIKF